MATRTVLELEKGKIEFADDGETKVYTYAGTPIDQLTDEQRTEILESPMFKQTVFAINELAEQISKIVTDVIETAVPILNNIVAQYKAAADEAEKAKQAKKKKPAKKVKKTDE